MAVATGTALLAAGGLAAGAGAAYGARKQSEATRRAARTQERTAQQAIEEQRAAGREFYDILRPTRAPGLTALPLLQYMATGQAPALGTTQQAELTQLQAQPFAELTPMEQSRLAELQGIAQAGQAARGGLAQMVTQSPMYQLQQAEGERALNRILAARGRAGSTFGINAMADLQRRLLAEETGRLESRLMNLANLSVGAAGQTGRGALQTGGALAELYRGAGAQQAGLQTARGEQKAGLYGQLGALPLNLASIYAMGGGQFGGRLGAGLRPVTTGIGGVNAPTVGQQFSVPLYR